MRKTIFTTNGVWLLKFFRQKILSLNSDQILELIKEYEKEVDNIRSEAMQFAWYMRGGLSYEDSLYLSASERKIISKLIDNNIETTKKSGLPFF